MSKLFLKVSLAILVFGAYVAVGTLLLLPRLIDRADGNVEWIIALWLVYVLVPIGLFFIGWRFFRGRGKAEYERIMHEGQKAPATVLAVEDTGVTLDQVYFGVKLSLRVAPASGSSFDVKLSAFVPRISVPRAGETVTVAFDPQDKKKIYLADFPSAS